MQFVNLLLLGLLAAAANVAGGLLTLPSGALRNNERALKFLVALGAGFLLAANFIEILPRSLALWLASNRQMPAEQVIIFPLLLMLGGYLLVHFFEQTLTPHIHFADDHAGRAAAIEPATAYTAVGGMLFHSFFDGIAIAAAATINFKAGVLVFIAIFLHKLPEGFTVAGLMLAAGKSLKSAILASAFVGAATLFGALTVTLLGAQTAIAVPYLLPIAAGVALYVAASELIPELHHHGGKSSAYPLCVFAGVAFFFLLHHFLHRLL